MCFNHLIVFLLVRYSTSALLESIPYITIYKRTDSVCEDVVKLIEMLAMFPKNFGEEEEISFIERVSHPSLTSEEQIYDKKKGVPGKLSCILADVLITYEELGKKRCYI